MWRPLGMEMGTGVQFLKFAELFDSLSEIKIKIFLKEKKNKTEFQKHAAFQLFADDYSFLSDKHF